MATNNTKTAPGPAGAEVKPAKQAKIKGAAEHFQGILSGMYSVYCMVETGPVGKLFGIDAFEALVMRVRATNIYEIVEILSKRVDEPWNAVHISTTDEPSRDAKHWAISFELDASSPDEQDAIVCTYYVRCKIDPHLQRRTIPVSDEEWEDAVREYRAKREAEKRKRAAAEREERLRLIEEERKLLLDAVGTAF